MDKSQVLPNRKEARVMMRKFKHLRGSKRRKTKGAFGGVLKKSQNTDTKELTKINKSKVTEPVDNKEVKEKNRE